MSTECDSSLHWPAAMLHKKSPDPMVRYYHKLRFLGGGILEQALWKGQSMWIDIPCDTVVQMQGARPSCINDEFYRGNSEDLLF